MWTWYNKWMIWLEIFLFLHHPLKENSILTDVNLHHWNLIILLLWVIISFGNIILIKIHTHISFTLYIAISCLIIHLIAPINYDKLREHLRFPFSKWRTIQYDLTSLCLSRFVSSRLRRTFNSINGPAVHRLPIMWRPRGSWEDGFGQFVSHRCT